jgi:effector-binding domain-containing protein
MKIKFWIIITALFVFLICFLLLGPVTFNIKKRITINASIFNVVKQFTDLHNWKNWHPGLTGQDSSAFKYSRIANGVNSTLTVQEKKYTITSVNSQGIGIEEEENGDRNYQSISAFPDSFNTITHVTWIQVASFSNWVREKFKHDNEMEKGLKNLKSYMEDADKFYGFHIEIQSVSDTLLITKKAMASKDNIIPILHNLYADLYKYLQENNMEHAQRMAGFITGENDSVEIMAGITVEKKEPVKNGIRYMEMPRGRMLVGEYQGPYNKISQLYMVMNQYLEDKELKRVAMIYEKYFTDPHSKEDSAHMKIKIYCPIY